MPPRPVINFALAMSALADRKIAGACCFEHGVEVLDDRFVAVQMLGGIKACDVGVTHLDHAFVMDFHSALARVIAPC